jgi:hypothetical protein
MASNHAIGGAPIVLSVDNRYVDFLRAHFRGIRESLLDDLANHADDLRDPAADQATADLLGRWLGELDRGQLVGSTGQLKHVLNAHLAVVDEYNEYERVAHEHEAFAHLLAMLHT